MTTTGKPDLLAVLRGEEWRSVSQGVSASSLGRVWSHKYKRLLRCAKTREGYHTISIDGRTRNLHRLLAEVFIGPAPFEGAVVRHLNDVPDDNRVENLRWGTRSDNAHDALRNGLLVNPAGEAHAKARLTEVQVREIRAWATYDFILKDIAHWYGMSREAVASIVHRRNWRHVE